MKRWVLAAVACVAAACPDSGGGGSRPNGPSRSGGLKVPLPEGWRASASDDGVLHVRTEGREVMTMEVRPDSALPSSDGLEAAIGEGGGESLGALPLPDGALMRYRVATGAEGVLGVRRVGGRRLLCSSEPAAQQAELKTVAKLCSDAEWSAPQ
ncbi:MAG: hypothetical protein JNK82_20295 [Myxococcaceae bacterium]|nr:hypothetical protein [Myxococcaceae bacterium]